MSGYVFPTEGGTRAKYGDWDILLWMNETPIGDEFTLGYDDSGEILVVGVIEGPYDSGTWQSVITAQGGMGKYVNSKLPRIRQMLIQYFDTRPHLPVETNATPYTATDFNTVLKEYVAIQPLAGATHPTVNIVSYVPPT